MNRKNLLGLRIGTRTIVEEMPYRKNGYVMYKVKCDCGDEVILNGSYLKQKERPCKSCSAKLNTKKGKDHFGYKHGMATRTKGKDRIYSIWIAMRQRCNDINDKQYNDYGGRGIKVCEEWNEFMNFYNDMGERPEGMQLDRIDNDGNYYKENCKWSNRIEQANNRRSTSTFFINGKKVTRKQIQDKLRWTRDQYRRRFEKYGAEWIISEYKK